MVTVTPAAVTDLYSAAVAVTSWVMGTASSATASGSSVASTVSVCSWFQSAAVNVSVAGLTVTSVSGGTRGVTVTSPLLGAAVSTAAYSPVSPSGTVSSVGVTVTPAVSSSSMVTTTVAAPVML